MRYRLLCVYLLQSECGTPCLKRTYFISSVPNSFNLCTGSTTFPRLFDIWAKNNELASKTIRWSICNYCQHHLILPKIHQNVLLNSARCRIWQTDGVCLSRGNGRVSGLIEVVELSGADCNGNVFPMVAEYSVIISIPSYFRRSSVNERRETWVIPDQLPSEKLANK